MTDAWAVMFHSGGDLRQRSGIAKSRQTFPGEGIMEDETAERGWSATH